MITIVKIGGNVIDDAKALDHFLDDFARIGGKKILVHGGGKLATELSGRLDIPVQMKDGRRITDAATLQVAVMTYAGWISKTIVAALHAKGCPAIGLSGADANLIPAKIRKDEKTDYGFVGDPVTAHPDFLQLLLEQDICPVFCAITHDGNGRLLNTNADTIASVLAVALSQKEETQLIYCFEKEGVLRDISDPGSIVKKMDRTKLQELNEEGKIHSGMLPKLKSGMAAVQSGVQRVAIGHAGKISALVKAGADCTELVS